jgi:cold shock protein
MYDRPQRGGHRAPEITHRNVRATVKWFNPTKGFGFVTPEDGSPDAFLHATIVQFAGHDALADGTTIVCDLSRGPKGPQVANIHSVDTSTASAGAPRSNSSSSNGPSRGGYRDQGGYSSGGGDTETVDGTVKWFNVTKGFGFIAPADGGKDIFVHKSALDRSGLEGVADGEQVRVTVRQGAKGPEAIRIELG